ncbi:MAG: YtxH domain-containing protein [Muribaculaceae bacterium]|nr:YtxH domain-containing protein [Muribaculaceae bacterium]
MSNSSNILFAFVGGAIVGAGAALLLAPKKGVDMRAHIKDILKRKGLLAHQADIDELVEQLTIELDD